MGRRITRSLTTREERKRRPPDRFDPSPNDNKYDKLKSKIRRETCSGSKFYIGKTCGSVGIKGRYRDKYRFLNIHNMRELCRFDDESLAYMVEGVLVKYCKENSDLNCLNQVPGGHGGRAKNGPYIVYLAYE